MLALALTMLLQASPAADAAAPSEPRIIMNPDWRSLPTGAEFSQYYPERAQREEVTGRALVSCRVTVDGALEKCSVASEAPAGYGFGDAALKMVRLMTMKPVSKDGVATAGGTVRVPIAFHPPGMLDPLTGLYSCYGVTAANWQSRQSDPQASWAFGYFAAQAALRAGSGEDSPEAYEQALKRWREIASGPDARRSAPSLATCMKLVPPPPPAPK